MNSHVHAHHADIAKRLKRAEGHLRKVIAMIEQEQPCLDIVQQLHAVEKAIGQAKKTLIQDHLDHCLEATVGDVGAEQRRPIDEFKQITKYL
ncbi:MULTISPECIES: metal-sensing transcriptional repressor [Hyphomicrobiales]|jgi:DNA-binding FrmR family transcriptional regulator|uniref:Metal resistance protein n=1 Tax=Phreatobacter cathodiphilus TaxID=1868589 RepID=A0A2S0NG99_9HYPH|nr:metal-sensing transcriptional repressor [Phreatobacter cathodiphilus]AVO47066.1 metal resistance protein [Phreatobacter cathodiphilus]